MIRNGGRGRATMRRNSIASTSSLPPLPTLPTLPVPFIIPFCIQVLARWAAAVVGWVVLEGLYCRMSCWRLVRA